MNKRLIYGLVIIGVLGIGLFAFFKGPIAGPEGGDAAIDTSGWVKYENKAFEFTLMHPTDWTVYEAPNGLIAPAFNVYPKSYGGTEQFPLIHHSLTPNVSVFPGGVPTEGVFGDTVPSNIAFKEPPMRAFDFVLENGDKWATFAGYPYGPKSWNESGFLWARADVNDSADACVRDGKEMPVESCDFLGSGDAIIHRGSVDEKMRAIEIEILKSFEFTTSTTGGMIRVKSPEAGNIIKSPLIVRGEARGGWYFEADFPITLTDWDGRIISQSYATAQGEWMTNDFVPFEGKIEFKNPSSGQDFTKNGYLIFHKNNASGLPEHDRAIEIPIRFE